MPAAGGDEVAGKTGGVTKRRPHVIGWEAWGLAPGMGDLGKGWERKVT